MISDIILEQGLVEMSESGLLGIQTGFEDRILADLAKKMAYNTDVKDHLELVKVRGMIDGIRFMQSERAKFLESSARNSNQSAAVISKGRKI